MENSPLSLAQLLPIMVIQLLFAALSLVLARRKGRNVYLFTVLGMIPLVAYVAIIYLCAFTDRAVRERLDRIEDQLRAMKTFD